MPHAPKFVGTFREDGIRPGVCLVFLGGLQTCVHLVKQLKLVIYIATNKHTVQHPGWHCGVGPVERRPQVSLAKRPQGRLEELVQVSWRVPERQSNGTCVCSSPVGGMLFGVSII